jgi:uncharacterized protein involved in tellurium resistance
VAAPAPKVTSSLDLSDADAAPAPSTPAAVASTRPAATQRPGPERPKPPRVGATGRIVLSERTPTVTLDRLQSGIGTLIIEVAVTSEVGDLRMGAAYELESGVISTVQYINDRRLAPPQSRRPILVAGHERYERISVDLRQCRELRRVLVYAFSEGGTELTWGGTLIVTTSAGARVEVPLESAAVGRAAAVLSLYQVSGEFVLRSELWGGFTSVRDVSRAFGFEAISWLDDRTPVD